MRTKYIIMAILSPNICMAMSTYNKISGLLEMQGRAAAGLFRDFFMVQLNLLGGMNALFAVTVATHFILILTLPHPGVQGQATVVPQLIRKFIPMWLIWYCLSHTAVQDNSIYSFTDSRDVKGDTMISQGMSTNSLNPNKPISAINAKMWDYIDLATTAINETFANELISSDPTRRMPMLMQRVMAVSQNTPFLRAADRDLIGSYYKECQAAYLNSPEIKNRDLKFLSSLKDEVEGVDNDEVLRKVLTNVKNAAGDSRLNLYAGQEDMLRPRDQYYKNCAELRLESIEALNKNLRLKDSYILAITASSSSDGSRNYNNSLNDQEKTMVVMSKMYEELGSMGATMITENKIDPVAIQVQTKEANNILETPWMVMGERPPTWGSMSAKVRDMFYGGISQSTFFGTPELTNKINEFYSKAPIRYGFISAFFQITAEVCLIISFVLGKPFYLARIWAGMFVLKLLPLFWTFLFSVQQFFLFIATNNNYANQANFDYELQIDVMKELNHITEFTVEVALSSFMILLFFIPFGDIKRSFTGSAG